MHPLAFPRHQKVNRKSILLNFFDTLSLFIFYFFLSYLVLFFHFLVSSSSSADIWDTFLSSSVPGVGLFKDMQSQFVKHKWKEFFFKFIHEISRLVWKRNIENLQEFSIFLILEAPCLVNQKSDVLVLLMSIQAD